MVDGGAEFWGRVLFQEDHPVVALQKEPQLEPLLVMADEKEKDATYSHIVDFISLK